uniref:Uncharacterized protein n=1 Tax=Knipowitschia caucasica TaxID=637954 RepID=A0AAV2JFU4_KNICA
MGALQLELAAALGVLPVLDPRDVISTQTRRRLDTLSSRCDHGPRTHLQSGRRARSVQVQTRLTICWSAGDVEAAA